MEKTTTTQTAIKWGAIAGIYSIVSSVATFLGLTDFKEFLPKVISFLVGTAVMVGILVFAFKEFKAKNNEFMTYGQGLGIGSLIGAISGVMGGIFGYIYLKFFDSSFLTNATALQVEKMEEQGMDSAAIEQAQGMMAMFTEPSMFFVMNVLGGILVYFIVALIVAAFQKNEKSVFE